MLVGIVLNFNIVTSLFLQHFNTGEVSFSDDTNKSLNNCFKLIL